jgi:hypothetical protein
MPTTRQILLVSVVSWIFLLPSTRPVRALEEWQLFELHRTANVKYEAKDYSGAVADYRRVLAETKLFSDARLAAYFIFRIWEKGQEGSTSASAAVNDTLVEQSLNSLARFDGSKKPAGIMGETEGEEAVSWRALWLAQYYEKKKMPQQAVEQRKIGKSVYGRLVKAQDRMTEKRVKLNFYSCYIHSCVALAEAYLANSDKKSCAAELANLQKFLEGVFDKEIQPTDYDDHPQQLYLQELEFRVEVPLRIAKCFRRLGMENEAKASAGRAQSALDDFKKEHPTVPEMTAITIGEIEKALRE